jgi:hypothetical protein
VRLISAIIAPQRWPGAVDVFWLWSIFPYARRDVE